MANESTIAMSANQEIEITVPVDPESRQGVFPKEKDKTVRIAGQDREHILGFVSENILVGTIEPVDGTDELKVKYKHLQSASNRIYFFTAYNAVHVISIISMQIHDHSSIYQGGPAYGTYASDIQVKKEPEV